MRKIVHVFRRLRSTLNPIVAIVITLALLAQPAQSDTVRTADGQTHLGAVRLEDGRVVVKPAQGPEVVLALADVRQVLREVAAETALARAPEESVESGRNREPGKLQGLKAEYFGDRQMKQLLLLRLDEQPMFEFSAAGSPHPRVPRNFSARWTGQIEPPDAVNTDLWIEYNGPLRIWIDGALLVDRAEPADRTKFSVPLKLEANRKHEFRCEYSFHSPKSGACLKMGVVAARRGFTLDRWLIPPEGTVNPTISIISPRVGEVITAPAKVDFEFAPEAGDHKINQVRIYIDERQQHVIDAPPWRWQWDQPVAGYRTLWVEAMDDQGMTSGRRSSHLIIGGSGGGTLPAPWVEMPIGGDKYTGSARWRDGAFTLTADDGDMWGKFDLFHYVFQPMTGDGTIIARLVSAGPDVPSTSAGLVIRPGLARWADTLFFVGKTSATIVSMRREKGSSLRLSDEVKAGEPEALPRWLKLTRQRNTIKSYHSVDGKDWRLIGSHRVDMPRTVWVGMALVGSPDKKSQAVFSDVLVTPGAPELETGVAGVVLKDGSMIAGQVRIADGASIKFSRGGELISVPLSEAARLIFAPMPAESAAALRPGRTGAVMVNGDFLEGGVFSLSGGSLVVESVLFGQRKVPTVSDAVAAVLADVKFRERKFEITAADGSVLRSDTVRVVGDRLKVDDVAGLSFELPCGEIRELRSMP